MNSRTECVFFLCDAGTATGSFCSDLYHDIKYQKKLSDEYRYNHVGNENPLGP